MGHRGHAALYCRLSREDKLVDESNSIAVQKAMLERAAHKFGYTRSQFFIDDGYSGADFNRPAFKEMNRQIEIGLVSAVLVKDLSRLGRDHIQMGEYLETFLPEHNVRFISVSESVDSVNGLDDFVPILNVLNAWYSRDLGNKVHTMQKMRASEGIPLSQPPYGYMKDPNEPDRWVMDEYAAKVVQQIYSLALEGQSLQDIADTLERGHILTPKHYWHEKGIRRGGKLSENATFKWSQSTLANILKMQEYCGDVLNFKTPSKYSQKALVFKDVHESIIDRHTWEQVQKMRERTRSRKAGSGKRNLFSVILRCADCGNNMHFHVNSKNPNIEFFTCSNYTGSGGTCPNTHYVRVDHLQQTVLKDIQRITREAKGNPSFWEPMIESARRHQELKTAALRQEYGELKKEYSEADKMFDQAYEDNVKGVLSDKRFKEFSRRLDVKQEDLKQRMDVLEGLIQTAGTPTYDEVEFRKIITRHAELKELMPRILREFVERIDVYPKGKAGGRNMQRIDIHYSAIGLVTLHME